MRREPAGKKDKIRTGRDRPSARAVRGMRCNVQGTAWNKCKLRQARDLGFLLAATVCHGKYTEFPSELESSAGSRVLAGTACPNGTRFANLGYSGETFTSLDERHGMEAHLFGPVPSRRLGRSLGIDLVPFKTCSYDCVYCQLGPTTERTCERREWVPVQAVLEEIEARFSGEVSGIDYLTFSGSGEPTLHARIGELIRDLKQRSSIPVAVLTNGSLLWQKEVQDDLMAADLVIPSLDAPDAHLFQRVNRPHPDLDFEQVVDGMARFGERYPGTVWLEIFLLAGITGMAGEVKRLAGLVRRLKPACVQLMTVARPPQEEFATAVSREQMERLAQLFEGVQVLLPDAVPAAGDAWFAATREQVLELLQRRPCTVRDLSVGLGIPRAEAGKYVEDLFGRGYLKSSLCNGERFFFAETD